MTKDFKPAVVFGNLPKLPLPRLPERPDPKLLDGSTWDRREFQSVQDTRVDLRQLEVLESFDIDDEIFRLALQMERDPQRYEQARALLQDPRFEMIRQQLDEIRLEETGVFRQWLSKQLTCTLCKQEPKRFGLGDVCESCHGKLPSKPPVGGIQSALSRARSAGVPATLTKRQWQRTVEHFKDRCAYCGGPWCVVEHATPLPLGGTTADNCLPSCASCNNTKRGLAIEELKPTERVVKALAWLHLQGRRHKDEET